MKVSFPYMGCVTGYAKLFELLGHEVIMPNKPTQRTIDLGVKYSPEFICFPYKVMMGTYVEVLEQGAEVIVSSGGDGPCRAGLYGEVHEKILQSMGYNVEIIIFDSIFRNFNKFKHQLKLVTNGCSAAKFMSTMNFVYKLISKMDFLEKKLKILRAYELNPGDFNQAWTKIVKKFEACYTNNDLNNAYEFSLNLLNSTPMKPKKDRMRFGIVGEIYVIMESSVNMDIEQKLNKLGIEVENVQYISDWIRHNAVPQAINQSKSVKVIKKAKEFAHINCGGHDMENIGWMVDFSDRGFDAVIHLMPFGCLPELVTQSAIPTISKELNMPILSLSLDEQMGSANNQTRIEAFVDLVKAKKQMVQTIVNSDKNREILSRNVILEKV